MPIVATAGHVDHGKSTLVKALTGSDPDRWAEEKERGLTIDLGFAWVDIADQSVGIIDVPGHERFIKNMLAGVGGIDVAMLIVAADEGWKPQTEEHMAVLDLLKVPRGIVVVTRVDLADSDSIELTQLDIEERIAGTTAAKWPVVSVSAVTGEGMEGLRAQLAKEVAASNPIDLGRPRVWIDRSFLIGGAGLVVTGTLLDGSLTNETSAIIAPAGRKVRIRGIQTHEQNVSQASPGSRVAINLSGIDRIDAGRGTLLTTPGVVASSSRFIASYRMVRGHDELTDRGAYQVHFGSGGWSARIRVISESYVQVATNRPVPMVVGDRFILRETGRRAIVAGGRVLEPRPGERSASQLLIAASEIYRSIDFGPDAVASALLSARGEDRVEALRVDSGGGSTDSHAKAGGRVLSAQRASAIVEAAAAMASGFHRDHPLQAGVPKASMASMLEVEAPMLGVLIASHGQLIDDGATVRLRSHNAAWTPPEEDAWKATTETLLKTGLAVPRVSQLNVNEQLIHAAMRSGLLIRIGEDLAYLPSQLEEVKQRLTQLPEEFTVADFRDTMEVKRRHAVPLLEWLDRSGVTARRGDLRRLKTR